MFCWMDPSGKPTGQLWDCSTAAKPKTAPPPPGPAALGAAGPQDLNCTRNPDFCTANQARIEMCSMDLLLGDRTIPNVNGTNGTTLNFKGRALLAASLTELGKLGLNKATHVVLTGETHAGTAALLVADEMARQLKLISPGLKVFKVLPADGMHPRFDSMFAQSLPGLTTLWMDQALQSMAALANVTGALNQDCVAANLPNESYKCLYFAEALSHVKTPTFGARGRLMTNNYRPATAFAAPAARRPGGALSTTCAAEAARGTSLTLWLSPPPFRAQRSSRSRGLGTTNACTTGGSARTWSAPATAPTSESSTCVCSTPTSAAPSWCGTSPSRCKRSTSRTTKRAAGTRGRAWAASSSAASSARTGEWPAINLLPFLVFSLPSCVFNASPCVFPCPSSASNDGMSSTGRCSTTTRCSAHTPARRSRTRWTPSGTRSRSVAPRCARRSRRGGSPTQRRRRRTLAASFTKTAFGTRTASPLMRTAKRTRRRRRRWRAGRWRPLGVGGHRRCPFTRAVFSATRRAEATR